MAVTNVSPPTISGGFSQGNTLNSTTGAWNTDQEDTTFTFAYQWKRCNASGSSCVNISGATTANYTLVAADVGSTIRVQVTATEAAFPPPPVPGNLPAVITAGGTYSGSRVGTVAVRTTQPVIIESSSISNTGVAPLLDINHAGAQVIVRNTTFTGAPGDDGMAVEGALCKSVLIENCDITYTWGLRVDAIQSGGSFIVRRCKVRNIQAYQGSGGNPAGFSHFFQTASNGTTNCVIDCSWNDVVNEWTLSGASDIVSIHSTHGPTSPIVHDNYIEGSWVDWNFGDSNPNGGHSGSGVMIEESDRVLVYNNIVVACTNCGIGMASGGNNKIYDNRCVASGKTPDNQQLAGSNVGIYCEPGTGGNQVYDNHMGWMGHPGGNVGRNDAYLPLDGGAWYVQNTYFSPGNLVITRAMELAEYQTWLARVSAAGVTIGVA